MSEPSDSVFNQFTTNKYINGSKEFIESNSLVAKFAFLLLVFFVFFLCLRLGILFIGKYYSANSSPKLINGMVDAKQLIIISQDPLEKGSMLITRSVDARDGIEFTWSSWVFIDDLTYNSGKYKCIFYKGNDYNSSSEQLGINFPNNAPGLYIAPNTNKLIVMMNTYNVINEEIIIDDVPMNKWMNIIIRCQNNILDIYINGTIAKSHKLHGVPKQNYGNVYIAPNGGFSGYISNLWYFDHALGLSEINKIVTQGPNTKMSGNASSVVNAKQSDYLSMRWFLN